MTVVKCDATSRNIDIEEAGNWKVIHFPHFFRAFNLLKFIQCSNNFAPHYSILVRSLEFSLFSIRICYGTPLNKSLFLCPGLYEKFLDILYCKTPKGRKIQWFPKHNFRFCNHVVQRKWKAFIEMKNKPINTNLFSSAVSLLHHFMN